MTDADERPRAELETARSQRGAAEGGPGGPQQPDTAGLLALIARLEGLLERSDLDELEVEAGGTAVVLRNPAAVRPFAPAPSPEPAGATGLPAGAGAGAGDEPLAEPEPAGRHAILAPLTGLFYLSPSPGAAPYVQVGSHVAAGQVIGLIEAMKLFNEIKSDATGTVTRIVAESGALVKAKQPLIEVQPV